jgi:hypothetical protein
MCDGPYYGWVGGWVGEPKRTEEGRERGGMSDGCCAHR